MVSLLGQNIFKKTKDLEKMIASFLLNIVQAGLYYQQAVDSYLAFGAGEAFLRLRQIVSSLEKENDAYRRQAEANLYAFMILPDMRSDILKLLEGCDKIINKYESNLLVVSAEKPHVPHFLKEDIAELVRADLECVSALMGGVKAFFDGEEIQEFSQNVFKWEHKVDKDALSLKEKVFQADLDLAHQIQLKEFIYSIEKISDLAEDAGDILNIMAVKHIM